MRELIDELKAVPGVMGANIYSSTDGLLATNLPAIFKPERLNAVGKHLAKLYSAGRLSFDDLTDLTLSYDESVVVARELDKNLLLFTFCDPSFNHNLLSMSFNLLQEDYRAGNFSDAVPTASAPAASTGGELDEELVALLDVLRQRLSKILGPMAGMIFDERLAEWCHQGPADISRIDALLSGVHDEIADDEKVARYQQLIEADLAAFQER